MVRKERLHIQTPDGQEFKAEACIRDFGFRCQFGSLSMMFQFYWRRDAFQRLSEVADEAARLGYPRFAEYCRLREKGLREKAFDVLEGFIHEALSWDIKARRRFVDWQQTICFHNRNGNDLNPHPLKLKLVNPTIDDWMLAEPQSSVALRWREAEEDVLAAIRIDPKDEIAVQRLAAKVLARADYATHELPWGWCGAEPLPEMLSDLVTIENVLIPHRNALFSKPLETEVSTQRALTESWLEYSQESRFEDFQSWATRRGKPFSSGNWSPPIG